HADTLEHWLERADARGWGVARLCAGDPAHDLAELRASACAARDLLDYARSRLPGRRVVILDGHRLASLLFSQRDSWQVRQLLAPLQRLLDHDPQGSLAATLESWCAHDGHAQACAQALGIHRNSLRYRLERIASISGLDLARLEHRQQLLLGLQLLVPRRG
ncbi:TPA: helix-turn-helix domain-containing protein, partial [Pseudomonas aeruginosa]|nr:helix-turn-helix domain-containing protein [Pseudomonas aeruginosa]